MTFDRRPALALALVAATVAGCTVMPPAEAPNSLVYMAPDYADRTPIEIAVLLPNEVPNFPAAHAALMRERLYGELLSKGYTCLNPTFVDGQIGALAARLDALRGAIRTDAFMSLELISVKEVPGLNPGIYRLEARGSLVDPAGAVLFDHQMPMTFEVDFGPDRELSDVERSELYQAFVRRLLRDLPARRS